MGRVLAAERHRQEIARNPRSKCCSYLTKGTGLSCGHRRNREKKQILQHSSVQITDRWMSGVMGAQDKAIWMDDVEFHALPWNCLSLLVFVGFLQKEQQVGVIPIISAR